MAGSKYIDTAAAVQVIGSILREPNLLDDQGYFFSDDDFTSDLHKVIFAAANNLFKMGADDLSINAVEDYLSQRPKSYAIFKNGKGAQWMEDAKASATPENFDYYYSRVKKMTLLRGYEKVGLDLRWLYDPDNILDIEKKKQQEDALDAMSLNDLADAIDNRVMDVRSVYVDNASDEATAIGSGLDKLMSDLKSTPEMGLPLYGPLINGVVRGARLKKFYMRSASSGTGKSRSMIADACYIACSHIYENDGWIPLTSKEPALFISTELELSEIQTMALAFLSNVNEEKILSCTCTFEEQERVDKAYEILKEAPLYVEILPDFTLQEIENCIKRNIRVNKTHYIFYDYLSTSLGILEEITSRAHGTKLREDNVLFMLSNRLKDICNQYNVFILTASQLNETWKTDELPDQNLLRGAKSLADKLDCGMILLDVTQKDKDNLQQFCLDNGIPIPNVKLSIYKNRRGSFTKGYLWMHADKGTCRFRAMFATDWQYNLIPVTDYNVTVIEAETVEEPTQEEEASVEVVEPFYEDDGWVF